MGEHDDRASLSEMTSETSQAAAIIWDIGYRIAVDNSRYQSISVDSSR